MYLAFIIITHNAFIFKRIIMYSTLTLIKLIIFAYCSLSKGLWKQAELPMLAMDHTRESWCPLL